MTNFTITKNPTEFSHVKPGDTAEPALLGCWCRP